MKHFNDLTILKYDNEGKLERRFIEMTQKKSKTKNCHYIFIAYLKSWADGNNLKIYDKHSKEEIPKGFSVLNHFSKSNLYNFQFGMLTNVRLFPLIYEDFKEMISAFMQENEVIIFYKNTEFDIYKKNLGCLLEKENIDFYRNNQMLCKKEKNILYTKLSQNKSTLLEDKFNELIENNWQSFLSNLQGKIDGTTFNFIYLTNEELSLLKLTVLTMLLRIENTPGIPGRHYAIEKSLSKLSSLMPSVEKKNQFNNLVKNLNVSNLKFLKDIYDLLFNEDNFTLKKVMFEQYKLNFEFFVIKNNDYEFLTSDVPCFEVFNNFEATNLNNGIYFPLSPKILTILRIDDQPNNFINVFEVKEDRIKYFNWLIYNNCQQYVIFKSKLVFK